MTRTEFDFNSLSEDQRLVVKAYGHYVKASWDVVTANALLTQEYKDVVKIAYNAVDRLYDTIDALYPAVESIAIGLGAKPNEKVGFYKYGSVYGIVRKWLVAYLTVGKNKNNGDN